MTYEDKLLVVCLVVTIVGGLGLVTTALLPGPKWLLYVLLVPTGLCGGISQGLFWGGWIR